MLSAIDPRYRQEAPIQSEDLDRLLTILRGRTDMDVSQAESEDDTGAVTVTLVLPDAPTLDGSTVYQAVPGKGTWWNTSSDSRFMP